jgi:hypothetical protein
VLTAHDTGYSNKVFRLWMQLCTEPPSSEGAQGVQLSNFKSTTRHHACKLADLVKYYHLRRVCVEKCDAGASYYHEDSLPGDIIGAEGVIRPVEQP